MTNAEAIKDLKDYKELPYVHDALSDEVLDMAIQALQGLSEEDYTELRDRFGTEVESVVRDMISGKGERWNK